MFQLIIGKDMEISNHFLSLALSQQYNVFDFAMNLHPIRICLSGPMLEYIMQISNFCCILDTPLVILYFLI
jgi:hypothetical protein